MGQLFSSMECRCNELLTSDTRMRFCRSFYRKCKVSSLPYETLVKNVGLLNNMTDNYVSDHGKKLHFDIVEGTDKFMWWRSTIIIAMKKLDFETGVEEGRRDFTLCQFMQVYSTLNGNIRVLETAHPRRSARLPDSSLQAYTLDKDCSICMERPRNVILPCTHAFCSICIQQWNLEGGNCPLCRETLGTLGDAWEVTDCPLTFDVEQETQLALETLLSSCT